jgi:hypothetical protein
MDTLNLHIQHLLFEIQRKAKVKDHIADLAETIDLQESNLMRQESSLKTFRERMNTLKGGYNLPFWGNKNKEELEIVDQEIKSLSLKIAKLTRLIKANYFEKDLLEKSLDSSTDLEFELNQTLAQKEKQLCEESKLFKIQFSLLNGKITKLKTTLDQLTDLIKLHPKIKFNQTELDRILEEFHTKNYITQDHEDSYFAQLHYKKIVKNFLTEFSPKLKNFIFLIDEYNNRATKAQLRLLNFEETIYQDFISLVQPFPTSQYPLEKAKRALRILSKSFLNRLSEQVMLIEAEIGEIRNTINLLKDEKRKEVIKAVTKKPDTNVSGFGL